MTKNWPAKFPAEFEALQNEGYGKRIKRIFLQTNIHVNREYLEKMDAEGLRKYRTVTSERNGCNVPEGNHPDMECQDVASTLLEAQETTSSKQLKGTYRKQFMQGNEKEYEATIEALREMSISSGGSRLIALDGCRRFAYFARDPVTGDVRVMTDSCKQRWCPVCANQKAKFAKESTQLYIESLERPRFLTLTLKHQEGDLLPQIQFLQDCLKRIRQRAYWKRNVTGGIWFLQVHRSESDGCWHPHLHILLDGNYMEQARLSELWEQITYGSPVIHIKAIQDPADSAKYVARYSARPAILSKMPLIDRIEVIAALHGKRMCGTFGNAKCVTLSPPKVENGPEWEQIGWYDKVVSEMRTNLSAMAIVNAWKTDSPLAEKDFLSYTAKPDEIKFTNPVTKKSIQYYLDFYNTS